MSFAVENPFNWYEANNFNGSSALQNVESIITHRDDKLSKGTHERTKVTSTLHRRFDGPEPGMLRARRMEILPGTGLSIHAMCVKGLLDMRELKKFEPSMRYDFLVYQGMVYIEFAYNVDQPVLLGSRGLTLSEQRTLVWDHYREAMDKQPGIYPGIHNLRDTLDFCVTFYSAHGRYPVEAGEGLRTFDPVWVKYGEVYHPTVWVGHGKLGEVRLSLAITGEDNIAAGAKTPLCLIPSN